MSARSIPRISRNIYRSGRVVAETFMQPQKQKMTFNTIRNMQFRNVSEFAEIPSFRAMAKMNKFNRVTRMELTRINVMLATSLVSKTAAITQMLEEILKSITSNEEEDEGSGSRVFPFDDV